jgi:Zn-dependent alcohol dehydrogenase
LISRRYTLEQINDAVHDLEQGRILGRSIITFDA